MKSHLYIVLTRTGTVLSRMIGFVTNDDFTHAAISLDENLNQMYSFGRKKVYNPFVGSFIKENLDEGIYGMCPNLQGVVIEVDVSRQQYNKAVDLIEEFINNSSIYKYNYMGLIDGLLNNEACYSDRFLCSEFVYYILNSCGAADLNIPRNLVRPQTLLDVEGRIVFRGNLKNMKHAARLTPSYKYARI